MGDSPSRSIRTSHKGPRFCSLLRGIESISPLWPGHASPRPTSKAAAAAEATRGVSTSAGTVWASRRSTGSRDVAGLVSRRREPAGRREDSPLFRSGERVGVPQSRRCRTLRFDICDRDPAVKASPPQGPGQPSGLHACGSAASRRHAPGKEPRFNQGFSFSRLLPPPHRPPGQ